MKRTTRVLSMAAALALTGTAVGAATYADASSHAPAQSFSASTAAASTKLTTQQAQDLAYMREEERMARDLYRVFADKYDGARPFSNIVHAEQRHYDAVGLMLTRYGVSDPSAGKAAGTYAFPELQRDYDAWKAQGMTSQLEATRAAISLEKADIADLQRVLKDKAPNDIKTVYSALLRGSQNHLRAYTRASEMLSQGITPGQGGKGGPGGPGGRQGRGGGMGPGGGQGGQGPGVGTGVCPLAPTS